MDRGPQTTGGLISAVGEGEEEDGEDGQFLLTQGLGQEEDEDIPLIGMTVVNGIAGSPSSDASLGRPRAKGGVGGGALLKGSSHAEHHLLKEHYHKMMSGQRGNEVDAILKKSTVMSLTTPLLRRMLIKRLADEVTTLYCVLELDDALSILRRHNSDAEKSGIDLVILELDRSTQNMALKLMEHLATRATLPNLSQAPLVPVVMLLHDDVDVADQLHHCQELGLAGFLEESFNREDFLMFYIGDIVRRYQMMHSIFQTVRNLRVLKYPYFAIPEAETDDRSTGDRSKNKAGLEDDSVTSADSWSVGSDMMETSQQEHRIYKHKKDQTGDRPVAKRRGSKFLVGLIRHKLMPTVHLMHLYDICDPRARPKLYRDVMEGAGKGTMDVNTMAGSKFALTQVSAEMAPFVLKEKPHGSNLNKSARGLPMSRVTAASGMGDPWKREPGKSSFLRRSHKGNSLFGQVMGGHVGGGSHAWLEVAKRLVVDASSSPESPSVAEEDRRVIELMRSPSKDNFPSSLSQNRIAALHVLSCGMGRDGQRLAKECNVDLLQHDLMVPEPLELKSQAVNNFVCKGFKYHCQGQVARAMPYYQHAVQLDPQCPTGYFYRGVAYENQKDYLRAFRDFTKALKCNELTGELDPQVLLFNRSVVATKLGMDHYAILDLNQALLSEPRDTTFLANRAMIHRRHGQFHAATQLYKKLWNIKEEHFKQKKKAQAQQEQPPPSPLRTQKSAKKDFLLTQDVEESATPAQKVPTPRRTEASASPRTQMHSKSASLLGGGRLAITGAILQELREDGSSTTGADKKGATGTTPRLTPGLKRQETARIWRSRAATLETTQVSSLTTDFVESTAMFSRRESGSPTRLQAKDKLEKLEYRAVINNAVSIFDATFGCPSPLQEALTALPKMRSKEQVEIIVDEMSQHPIFYNVDRGVLRKAAMVIEYRVMQEDKVIALQGHSCDALYLIMRGKISAKIHSKDETHVSQYTLVQGDHFGDMALVDAAHPINYHTYISEAPTEMMMLLKHDFDRLLTRHCFERLKARYLELRKLKLFQGWDTADLTRLARMSHVKEFPARTTILQQSEKPAYLHIVLRGTCKVTKVPSRNAELIQKKMQLEDQIMRIKTKYAYHHSIKPKPPPPGGDPRLAYMTHTEIRHEELLADLAKVERDLEYLGRDQTIDDHTVIQEIKVLTPPAIFGEEGVLNPQHGVALGSFVSDTCVQILLIHKIVFQTFQINDSFLTRMQSKAIIYPSNEQVIDMHHWEKAWAAYRRDVILSTPKERWPVSKLQIHYMAGGKSYVQDVRDSKEHVIKRLT